MNEQKQNGRGIFYGVIGVATLIVAIIGATFAYFTATADVDNVITGNMASISFGVTVEKISIIDENAGGLIPMSNSMVEPAVTYDATGLVADNSAKVACQDANGNAVCQIYRITLTNSGTVSGLFDGYVALTGGSGVPSDYTYGTNTTTATTMRWAQVYCTGDGTYTDGTTSSTTPNSGDLSCTTALTGSTVQSMVGLDSTPSDWTAISSTTDGFNTDQILTSGVTSTGAIGGNSADYISTNYIRVSDHDDSATFTRSADTTSALIYNQQLNAASVKYLYIAVWLTETDTNQNVGADDDAAQDASNFFTGKVSFYSAEGNEVTASFSSYASAVGATTSGD